ncbi:hypothetical protein [Litorivita sp. NS0012-18]|uniref:hypothetical protein n=1 Tax=Litorivita sp. NS0012-18 TaxID=3127655 RepID=UPI00310B4B0A
MKGDEMDPKALIREAYHIEGIRAEECRSVFLDWALSLPAGLDAPEAAKQLLTRYGAQAPEHPMTQVLREAGDRILAPKRRGGRSTRIADA